MPIDIKVPGKFILCGEHAVIRGKPAVAMPLNSSYLTLSNRPDAHNNANLQLQLQRLLKEAHKTWGLIVSEPLNVFSTITIQAGQGSSAALSVALARYFYQKGLIAESEIFATAQHLENIYHGISSGIDIAAVHFGEPIFFVRGQPIQKIAVKGKFHFYLTDSGLRSSTKECVAKVMELNRPDLDNLMEAASQNAMQGLQQGELQPLVTGMKQAQECFDSWGLNPPQTKEIINQLYNRGALAAKISGSGNGGFVLSVWPSEQNAPDLFSVG